MVHNNLTFTEYRQLKADTPQDIWDVMKDQSRERTYNENREARHHKEELENILERTQQVNCGITTEQEYLISISQAQPPTEKARVTTPSEPPTATTLK